jgi:hypothetical protein
MIEPVGQSAGGPDGRPGGGPGDVVGLDEPLAVGPDFDALRWFWLPDEVARELAAAGRPR